MARNTTVRQLQNRTSPLSVSFSQSERDVVRRAAGMQDESVSAFIRDAAVKAAELVAKPRKAA